AGSTIFTRRCLLLDVDQIAQMFGAFIAPSPTVRASFVFVGRRQYRGDQPHQRLDSLGPKTRRPPEATVPASLNSLVCTNSRRQTAVAPPLWRSTANPHLNGSMINVTPTDLIWIERMPF